MNHKFFISHFNKDKAVAELFSNALRRITLEQISPWFSSDTSTNSGLKPGDIWFNQILEKIKQSKAVVALLTPNSINKAWIYFESGIGSALPDCEIIPVCIGIKRDDIFAPLGLYQCYQLNDYRSVVDFFSKLLTLFQIKFDEEMSRVVIEKMVAEISQITFSNEEGADGNKITIEAAIENLKGHIDKRFLEVLEKKTYVINGDNLKVAISDRMYGSISDVEPSYSVSFEVGFDGFKNKDLFIEIRSMDTFQSITDSLYFMLSNFIDAYTYLEQWIIVEKDTAKHVVIREVADMIPAMSIFTPNTQWQIVRLKKPYSGKDSSFRIRHR